MILRIVFFGVLRISGFVVLCGAPLCSEAYCEEVVPDYAKHIAPMLKRYCVGCHNDDDREGDLSLESFASLQKGGVSGAVLLTGDSDASRLIRVLTGNSEPAMPPEGEAAPSAEQVQSLAAWIDAGAKGPDGQEPDRTVLLVPEIKASQEIQHPVTATAWSAGTGQVAVARFKMVEILRRDLQSPVRTLSDHPGKVNAVEFSTDGSKLVTASGIAGLFGRATIWDVASGEVLREFTGHRDIMYAAVISPDGSTLATAGYDRKIILWDTENGDQLRTMDGHNGAVYDLAFNADGTVLASASGDETIKLWQVATGERLDTLSQPLDEQYTVTFSPDDRFVLGGGADNRIRVWRFVSRNQRRINPLIHARFAHEGAVVQLGFSNDGKTLISVAEDRTIKLWETRRFTQMHAYEQQPDITQALAISPDSNRFIVGRMNGTLQAYTIGTHVSEDDGNETPVVIAETINDSPMSAVDEQEPNDSPSAANEIGLPAVVKGTIHPTAEGDARSQDADLFRFRAAAGEQWLFEIRAARNKSPLDSKIEILSADGEPIERVLLQAVRDSYFTFRGKDSDTSGDFRVHNWEEMELNEYLYANGEVVKLWLYPRGPDSGFNVYPGSGQRYTYFDTTANSHALHEPCYIVRPHPPGSTIIPNGLPVFPVYFENDDDSLRRWGTDSRLTFTAPSDGEFLVRVSDTRGFSGPDFKYELTVRPRQPDFKVTLHGANPTVNAGSGKEFFVKAERFDEFDGEIRVDISGVPAGFEVTTPLVIQAGHEIAYGVIRALPEGDQPQASDKPTTRVTATACINGQEVTKEVNGLGNIKRAEPPKLLVSIVPAAGNHAEQTGDGPLELVIEPGQTMMAIVRVQRNGFTGSVSFGKEDSGRNLPHGVYVDNIGLNGLLIPAGQQEREFFITAAKWVPETTRTFHLKAGADGGQTSQPVILHVRRDTNGKQ